MVPLDRSLIEEGEKQEEPGWFGSFLGSVGEAAEHSNPKPYPKPNPPNPTPFTTPVLTTPLQAILSLPRVFHRLPL